MAYVQFTDGNKTAILSVFSCPQDPSTYQNLGEVDVTDARYVAFMNPPAAPLTATPLQFRLGLTAANLRTQVEAWIPTASQQVQDAYKYASIFVENDPLVTSAATQFNLTTEQVHALFQSMQTLSP